MAEVAELEVVTKRLLSYSGLRFRKSEWKVVCNVFISSKKFSFKTVLKTYQRLSFHPQLEFYYIFPEVKMFFFFALFLRFYPIAQRSGYSKGWSSILLHIVGTQMKDILPYNDELPYHLGRRRTLMILKSLIIPRERESPSVTKYEKSSFKIQKHQGREHLVSFY